MKPSKKAKWIVATSGVTLSAIVLSQLGTATNIDTFEPTITIDKTLSKEEKGLLSLDWSNFESISLPKESKKSDRKTKRS